MTEQKILEKKKRELEKLVSARQEKENALRGKIQKAEEQKASAEANMQTAAEADDMMEYKKAKDDRDSAQDLIEFCQGRLKAIDTPYDADTCRSAVEAVQKEYNTIRADIMRDLAKMFEKCEDLCTDLIDACDGRRAFSSWVEHDLLRKSDNNLPLIELAEIRQLKNNLHARLETLFKDVKR